MHSISFSNLGEAEKRKNPPRSRSESQFGRKRGNGLRTLNIYVIGSDRERNIGFLGGVRWNGFKAGDP